MLFLSKLKRKKKIKKVKNKKEERLGAQPYPNLYLVEALRFHKTPNNPNF